MFFCGHLSKIDIDRGGCAEVGLTSCGGVHETACRSKLTSMIILLYNVLPGAVGVCICVSEVPLHVHLEHPVLGTRASFSATTILTLRNKPHTIVIGGGLTSKKIVGVTRTNIPTKFQVFTTLLPSICSTLSAGFE